MGKKLFFIFFNCVLISFLFINYLSALEVKEYYINLEVEKIESCLIRIMASTNFPDGTNFMITVDRIYHQKGKSERYPGIILQKKNIKVRDGKIETLEVKINDSIWYNKYHRKAEKFRGIIDFPGISRISPKIEVEIFFTPRGGSQSKDVLNILGTHGEFISGPGAKKESGWTYYRGSKFLDIPFKK